MCEICFQCKGALPASLYWMDFVLGFFSHYKGTHTMPLHCAHILVQPTMPMIVSGTCYLWYVLEMITLALCLFPCTCNFSLFNKIPHLLLFSPFNFIGPSLPCLPPSFPSFLDLSLVSQVSLPFVCCARVCLLLLYVMLPFYSLIFFSCI